MHAARLLSQKRKHRFEQGRPSRLHRGFPNGDLSISEDRGPWYADKWDERRSAFSSAKNAKGITLFHMCAIITFLGVVFMVVSLFASMPGLLEIGVTAFLFSLFCLIFVRCDEGKDPGDQLVDDEPLEGIVIEAQADDKIDSSNSSDPQTSTIDDSQREQIKSYLIRSSPRRIPSPCHIPYGPNFSPIAEVSEPSSLASSYVTRSGRSYEVSKLAKSQTVDSLGLNSSPIEEETEEENPEISLSNNNSFDTETEEDNSSMAAEEDASIMTVVERKGYLSQANSLDLNDPSQVQRPLSSSESEGQFTLDGLVDLEPPSTFRNE